MYICVESVQLYLMDSPSSWRFNGVVARPLPAAFPLCPPPLDPLEWAVFLLIAVSGTADRPPPLLSSLSPLPTHAPVLQASLLLPSPMAPPRAAAERPAVLQRFEDAVRGLSVTDSQNLATVAPLLKRFLHSAQELQRVLTPINASVHAAVSRASMMPEEQTTAIDWVSVFDRIGLFDVKDQHVARLVDSALRYVWRKEEADHLIASAGGEADRLVAERRRRDGDGPSRGEDGGDSGSNVDGISSAQSMTIPAMHARMKVSRFPPSTCIPSPAVLAAVQAVVNLLIGSTNPAVLAREICSKVLNSFQSYLLAKFNLDAVTMLGTAKKQGSSNTVTTAASGPTLLVAPPSAPRAAAGGPSINATPPEPPQQGSAKAGRGSTDDMGGSAATDETPAAALASGGGTVMADGDRGRAATDKTPAAPPADGGGTAMADGDGGGAATDKTPAAGPADGGGTATADKGGGGAATNKTAAAAAVDGGGTSMADGDAGGAVTHETPVSVPADVHRTGTADASKGADGRGLRYLMTYLRSTSWPTWKPERGGKGMPPVGTKANPTGSCTGLHYRSTWGHRVSLEAVKVSFDTPTSRFKLEDDAVLIVDMTELKARKSVSYVLGVLLLLCSQEPHAIHIVKEVAASSYSARPSRHPALLLSGLELERRVGGDGSDGLDGQPAAGPVDGAGATNGAGGTGGAGVADGVGTADGDGGDQRQHADGETANADAQSGMGGAAQVNAGGSAGMGTAGGGLPLRGGDDGALVVGAGLSGSRGGGAPADGDGILEGANVARDATYYWSMMQAAGNRAARMAVRRASAYPPRPRQVLPSDSEDDGKDGASTGKKRPTKKRKKVPTAAKGSTANDGADGAAAGKKRPAKKRNVGVAAALGPAIGRGAAVARTGSTSGNARAGGPPTPSTGLPGTTLSPSGNGAPPETISGTPFGESLLVGAAATTLTSDGASGHGVAFGGGHGAVVSNDGPLDGAS